MTWDNHANNRTYTRNSDGGAIFKKMKTKRIII
jgi:hypothetical protein